MKTVIVDSLAKAKAVRQILGGDSHVLAFTGMPRELASVTAPEDPAEQFSMNWQIAPGISKNLDEICRDVDAAETVSLAAIPDLAGEASSWHLLEILHQSNVNLDKPVHRVDLRSITKKQVRIAFDHPRELNMSFVDSDTAELAVESLFTDKFEPIFAEKVPGPTAVGLFHSVALRLLCEREAEVESFKPRVLASVDITLKCKENASIMASLTEFDGKPAQEVDTASADQSESVRSFLESGNYQIESLDTAERQIPPPPPYNTATLLQDAFDKLNFSAPHTLQIAQSLYDGMNVDGKLTGLISYYNTNSTHFNAPTKSIIDLHIREKFGEEFIAEKSTSPSDSEIQNEFDSEAIHPTIPLYHPNFTRKFLEDDQHLLYQLIWNRSVNSQMKPAQVEDTTVKIAVSGSNHTAKFAEFGSRINFSGFLENENSMPDFGTKAEILSELSAGESLELDSVEIAAVKENAPQRHTESTLIGCLHDLEIFLPLIHADSALLLRQSGLTKLENNILIPTDKGRILSAFFESHMADVISNERVAELCRNLRRIATGELAMQEFLAEFRSDISRVADKINQLPTSEIMEGLNESLSPLVFPGKDDGTDPRSCPKCGSGRLSLKLSRVSAFVGCSNHPNCRYTRQLGHVEGKVVKTNNRDFTKVLGTDPESGLEVSIRNGRFGPFVQLGVESNPKRVGLPKEWSIESVDLEKALQLLSLPREIGPHPESGNPIFAGIGRYGPFLLYNGRHFNLESVDRVFAIEVDQAAEVIDRRGDRKTRRWQPPNFIREIGPHPRGGLITLNRGRKGMYVRHRGLIANLEEDADPDSISIEQAVELLRTSSWRPYKRRYSRF